MIYHLLNSITLRTGRSGGRMPKNGISLKCEMESSINWWRMKTNVESSTGSQVSRSEAERETLPAPLSWFTKIDSLMHKCNTRTPAGCKSTHIHVRNHTQTSIDLLHESQGEDAIASMENIKIFRPVLEHCHPRGKHPRCWNIAPTTVDSIKIFFAF